MTCGFFELSAWDGYLQTAYITFWNEGFRGQALVEKAVATADELVEERRKRYESRPAPKPASNVDPGFLIESP
jgi:hypothetical protein